MENEKEYKITVAEKIRDLLKAKFGNRFKMYRVGDPIVFAQSELPAMLVTESGVRVVQDATGFDGLIHSLAIAVVLNKKDEMGRPLADTTLDTIIDNFVYGRDPVTNEYSENSVLGVLRRNYTMDNMTVQQEVRIQKNLVVRPEDALTAEATILVEVQELQVVNNRS